MRMSEPKRIHPISVVLTALKQLKEMIVPIIFVTIFGRRGSEWDIFSLGIPAAVIALSLIYSFIFWLRFTYRIEENELRIESGVFVRHKRYIPFERIHSLDQSEGILHRAFGLVKLKVETAAPGGIGKEEAEAVLAAISKQEANRFQEILKEIKNRNVKMVADEEQAEESLIYKMSTKELIMLATTSGGVGVILSAVIAFLTQIEELIPYKTVFDQFNSFITNGIVVISVLVLIGFLFVWFIALIGTMFKYANFSVRKTGADFVISRGLIEKRQITVPLKRIQSVRISQNILRQPFGYGTVFFETAGGSVENKELSKVMVLPIVKRKEMAEILGKWLPDYQLNVKVQHAPNRALWRYLIKGWLMILPVILIPPIFLGPWAWLTLLLILPITYLQYLTHHDAGWSIDENQLTLQFREINKHIVFVTKRKIQSVKSSESYFQRNQGLSTIRALVKSGHGGGGGRVIDIEREDAVTIFKWLSREKGNEKSL